MIAAEPLCLNCAHRSILSALSGDVGALRQAAAERGVLAGDLVEHDDQVGRGYPGGRHDLLVERLEEGEPRLLRTPGDECQFEQDHVVGVFLPNEGRRVEEVIAWQDMVDLK